jgi:hypothetical protein
VSPGGLSGAASSRVAALRVEPLLFVLSRPLKDNVQVVTQPRAHFLLGLASRRCPHHGDTCRPDLNRGWRFGRHQPRRLVRSALLPEVALAAILPRSLHRPLASTDGSSTRNLNKIGVRFWTDCHRRTAVEESPRDNDEANGDDPPYPRRAELTAGIFADARSMFSARKANTSASHSVGLR